MEQNYGLTLSMAFKITEILEEFCDSQQLGEERLGDGFVTFHPFETRQKKTHRERYEDEWSSWYRTQACIRTRRWKRKVKKDPAKYEAFKKRNREWERKNRQVPGKREELNYKQRIRRHKKQDEVNRKQRVRYHKAREGVESLGPSKLKAKQVVEIRARAAAGENSRELAQEYGVTYCAVWRIVKRLSWKKI